MFENLTTEGLEGPEDRLGGFSLLESGLYDGTIKLAYVVPSSKSKSQCVVTVVDYGGHEMTERNWITTGKGDPFYEKNGKKHMMPSFELINGMCLMATGLPLSDQDIEDKTIDLWDKDAGKEIPKSVPVITSLLGKPITAGILKQIVNKQEQQGNDWVDTNDTREENITDKYFHTESKKTVAEVTKKLDLAEEDLFYTKWGEKNTGNTRNRFKEVKGAASGGKAGSGSPAGAAKSKSLFS